MCFFLSATAMRSLAFLSTSPVKARHNSKALRKKILPKGWRFFFSKPAGLGLDDMAGLSEICGRNAGQRLNGLK
jgi:hypothetical protein